MVALSRKDIPPLSDRPIRRLPTDGEGKKSATIAGRAKREKTKTRGERERETFKAFRGITRKSYYRKRILPFVFGEWFDTFAPFYFEFSISDRISTKDEIFEFWIFTEFLFLSVYIRRAESFGIFLRIAIWMEPIEEYVSRIERWNFRILNFLFRISNICRVLRILNLKFFSHKIESNSNLEFCICTDCIIWSVENFEERMTNWNYLSKDYAYHIFSLLLL